MIGSHIRQANVDVIVPKLSVDRQGRKLVTPTVLVMEFCEGFKVTDIEALEAYNVDREALMRRICQACAVQVYVNGMYKLAQVR